MYKNSSSAPAAEGRRIMKSVHSVNMTEGHPLPILLTFAIPLFISNLFQQVYNMIDTMVVGQFVGANALAAVGSTGSITNIFFALNSGLASGIGIITAQHFGARNDAMVRKSIVTCLYLMSITALAMGGLGFLLSPALLRLLDTPPAILADAVLYMRISCLGLPATAIYNALSALLRATGNSKTPLLFLIAASVINLVLDLAFVVFLHWGVAGVAFATILAQLFSAAACAAYVMKKEPCFHIPKAEWKYDRALGRQAVCLGVPLALQSSMISVSCLALQRVVNGFGETVVAALTAGNRYESFVHLPLSSLGIALSTFTSQNIGAGKKERVTHGLRAGISAGLLYVLLMIPVTMLFGSGIIRFFTSDADVIAIGAAGIFTSAFFYIPLCIVHTTRGTINGAGDPGFSLLTGMVEVAARICLSAPVTAAAGFRGIWLTSGATWTFCAILGLVRCYSLFFKNNS